MRHGDQRTGNVGRLERGAEDGSEIVRLDAQRHDNGVDAPAFEPGVVDEGGLEGFRRIAKQGQKGGLATDHRCLPELECRIRFPGDGRDGDYRGVGAMICKSDGPDKQLLVWPMIGTPDAPVVLHLCKGVSFIKIYQGYYSPISPR